DATRELNPRRRLHEHLVSKQQVADDARAVVRRFLRKEDDAAVDEAALRHDLRDDTLSRRHEDREEHETHLVQKGLRVSSRLREKPLGHRATVAGWLAA